MLDARTRALEGVSRAARARRDAQAGQAGLTGADLTGADLTGANLAGAVLERAALPAANMTNVEWWCGFKSAASQAEPPARLNLA